MKTLFLVHRGLEEEKEFSDMAAFTDRKLAEEFVTDLVLDDQHETLPEPVITEVPLFDRVPEHQTIYRHTATLSVRGKVTGRSTKRWTVWEHQPEFDPEFPKITENNYRYAIEVMGTDKENVDKRFKARLSEQ